MLLIDESLAKSHIKGYTKADGTVVKPHEDKRQAAPKKPAKWSASASLGGSGGGSSGSSFKAPQYGLFGGGGGSGFGHGDWAPKPKPIPKAYHPKPGDKGQKVGILEPHKASLDGLNDPSAVVTITPGTELPAALNGVPFSAWEPPTTAEGWDYVDGVNDDLAEPPLMVPKGKEPASGLVIVEPDGRAWVVSPTNRFGGYRSTFPKGKVEPEMSFQANAIKEAWEEGGIKARVIGLVGDVERTTSVTRYYLAAREGGRPGLDVGWESQAVHLVPLSKLHDFLDASVDRKVVDLLAGAP